MVANPVSVSGGGCRKTPSIAKQDVSACRANLLKLMQRINFGRIERLLIRDGEPVLTPRPPVYCERKFGGENGPRSELVAANFLLKQQVVELFAFFDQQRDGTIDLLEIKHGLPFRMVVAEVPA